MPLRVAIHLADIPGLRFDQEVSIRVDYIETLCEDSYIHCNNNIDINKCLDDAEGMKQVHW